MAVWILIGLISLLIFFTLVALVLNIVLGRIGHDVSELLELEPWATTPIGMNDFVGDRSRKQVEQRPRVREPSWRSSAVRPDRSHRNA
jgi:hypothetical protein